MSAPLPVKVLLVVCIQTVVAALLAPAIPYSQKIWQELYLANMDMLYVDCTYICSYTQTKFSLVWGLLTLAQLTCMCSASYGIPNPMCTLLCTIS